MESIYKPKERIDDYYPPELLDPDSNTIITPEFALARIEYILSRCNGAELCMMAEVIGAVKRSLDKNFK